jgi:hypothetical protein
MSSVSSTTLSRPTPEGIFSGHHVSYKIYALILYLSGLLFVVAGRPGIASKFDSDALVISYLARNQQLSSGDKSFDSVAHSYATLGLANNSLLAGVLGLSVWYISINVLGIGFSAQTPFKNIFLLTSSAVLAAVYLGQFSKDFFALVAVLIFGLFGKSKSRLLRGVKLVILGLYALTFRNYWFLIICFYLVLIFLKSKIIGKKHSLLVVIAALLLASPVIAQAIFNTDLSAVRSDINFYRIGALDAQTLITAPLSLPTWAFGVNFIIILAELLLPWPLLILGGINHIASALGITIIMFTVLRRAHRATFHSPKVNFEILAFALAFLLVQSIFEPDYGSFLRHFSVLMPLLLSVKQEWVA